MTLPHTDNADVNRCAFVFVCGSTSNLGLGGVLGSSGEEQLSMLASRQRSILDSVVVHLSVTVLPLKGDTFICQFHRLQVSGGVQV